MEENVPKTSNNEMLDENGKFKKGNPGGPGRPQGRRNYAMIYADVLEEIGKENNMSTEQVDNILTKVAYRKASKGDYNFYRDIRDRIHGKPLQSHSVEGTGILVPQIVVFGENDPLYKQLKESQKLQ